MSYSFLKKTIPMLGIILLATGLAAPLRADPCGDIGKMGDGWHNVADFIDKHSDNGKLRKADVAKVQASAHKLMPETVALAKVLVEDFSSKNKDEARIKSLGKQLQANLDELKALGDEADWDDVGEIVSKIGDILSKLADICSDGK
jgi:hypothetical protein